MTTSSRHGWIAVAFAAALTGCGDSGNGSGLDGGGHDGAPADGATTDAHDEARADAPIDGRLDAGMDVVGDVAHDSGPVVPTVSSWMGTNLSGDLPFVEVTRLVSEFDTAAAQRDANGYPVAGASGTSATDLGFVLPTGMYNIEYTGDGTVDVSGIGRLTGTWQTVGSAHRNVVAITGTPGAFGQFLRITVQNSAGTPVQNLRILMPGYDYGTTEEFTAAFLRLLRPFRAMRAMDWEATNNSTLADWADRPRAAAFGSSPRGVPYEYLVDLANQTGKDLWVTIPEHASDDFVLQFAHFLAAGLDFARIQSLRDAQGFTTPFRLMFEYSNETWNGGFSAYNTLLAAANANPSRYTGVYDGTEGPSWMAGNSDLMKVGQYEADALARFGDVFRTAFAAVGHADAVTPVLSGWALGTVYSDVGLRFLQRNYNGVTPYVRVVATAPYFGPDEAQTGSLPTLFASIQSDIQSKDATYQDFRRLVDSYGIEIAAYEGGQGINGSSNLMTKHLAQHDRRMYQAYQDYFALWNQRMGEALFMHYTLAGTPGIPEFVFQYGFWGSIAGVGENPDSCGQNLPTLAGGEAIADVQQFCPKYESLQEHVPR